MSAYRLLSRDVEGVPGLSAERFGVTAVLYVYDDRHWTRRALRQVGRWYRDTLDLAAVYERRMVRHGSRIGVEEAEGRTPLVGRAPPDSVIVVEFGLRYLVRPSADGAAGLFLDQRENRRRVRELARGADVLNLFAYTCSFSVAAAAGGAQRAVSVDLSARHLDWGKRNFEQNGLDPSGYEFVRGDILDYLKQAHRRGTTFDLAIVDPPTFAHGRKRGRSFELKRDLADLLRSVVPLLKPDGVLLLSTNHRGVTVPWLQARASEAAGARRMRVLRAPPPPPDFASDPDHAKAVFLQFG